MSLTTRVPERRLLRIRGRARAGSEAPSVRAGAYRRESRSPIDAPDFPAHGGEAERRRFNRVALSSEVVVRRIGGFNFQVAVKDVSSGGCRVEMIEPCEPGDPVITRFPELEPLGSRVRWGEGTTTGIEFLTVIHPAVFEALLARLPQLGTAAE